MTAKTKGPPERDTGTNRFVRVNIQITKQQNDSLRKIAFERSLSRDQRASQAELVREAIDAWLLLPGQAEVKNE